jgi:uncharacterized DUF497 family protein
MVKIGFDPAKNATNIASRGLPFELVEQLDWAHALMEEDTRKAYGERRFQVLGFIGGAVARRCIHAARRQSACHQSAQGQFERGQEICQNAQTQN